MAVECAFDRDQTAVNVVNPSTGKQVFASDYELKHSSPLQKFEGYINNLQTYDQLFSAAVDLVPKNPIL